jgi:hypothetical protein
MNMKTEKTEPKVMKRSAIILVIAAITLTGCTSLSNIVGELAKDPAAVEFTVTTIHGTLTMKRAVPSTNRMSISRDGITTGMDN